MKLLRKHLFILLAGMPHATVCMEKLLDHLHAQPLQEVPKNADTLTHEQVKRIFAECIRAEVLLATINQELKKPALYAKASREHGWLTVSSALLSTTSTDDETLEGIMVSIHTLGKPLLKELAAARAEYEELYKKVSMMDDFIISCSVQ